MHSSSKAYVFRLKPKSDLKKSIVEFATANEIQAGVIVTCVGSLEQYNIRFANQKSGTKGNGFFEIVSLTGTFSKQSCHLHISISDSQGNTIGGHLLDENLVYTTAEICSLELLECQFDRVQDDPYGYHELVVRPRTKNNG